VEQVSGSATGYPEFGQELVTAGRPADF